MQKQIIIVRKDLEMSPGKLAAQVSHASMAFLSHKIREGEVRKSSEYTITFSIEKEIYEEWICGVFTKVILGAKNKNQLLKSIKIAEELGLREGKDFFPIKDNCYTELTPEEFDENGQGHTLTCIGFKPFDSDFIRPISKKYQLL